MYLEVIFLTCLEIQDEKLKNYKEKLAIELAKWDPNKDEKICTDPYKTIFVYRLVCDRMMDMEITSS